MLSSRLLLQQGPLSRLLAAGADYCLLSLQLTCGQTGQSTCFCAVTDDTAAAPASAWVTTGSTAHAQLHTSRVFTTSVWCSWAAFHDAESLGHQADAITAAEATPEVEAMDSEVESARAVTRSLRDAQTLQQLLETVQQSIDSLNPIHVSAALTTGVRLAKTADGEQLAVDQLLQLLTSNWQSFLQQAGTRELFNCLWACAKLGYTDEQLWNSSLDSVIARLGTASVRDLLSIAHTLAAVSQEKSAAGAFVDKAKAAQLITGVIDVLLKSDSVTAWAVSDVLWSAAKLATLPAPGSTEALLLRLSKHTQPVDTSCSQPADHTSPQETAKHVAIAIWALGELQQLPEAGSLASESTWHQVLSPEQLAILAAGGSFAVASSLAALGRLCTAQQHTLTVPFAQDCAKQLLHGSTASYLSQWSAVDIGEAVYGCGMMGVKDMKFLEAVAAAAPQWLPAASTYQVQVIAWGLGKLKFRDAQLMAALVKRGKQLLHGEPDRPPMGITVPVATHLSGAVAALNVPELAGDVKELIYSSSVKHWKGPLPAYAAVTLWRVHTWLVHQHLMGGHGLTRLLTEQQLAACAAATRHTHRMTPRR